MKSNITYFEVKTIWDRWRQAYKTYYGVIPKLYFSDYLKCACSKLHIGQSRNRKIISEYYKKYLNELEK